MLHEVKDAPSMRGRWIPAMAWRATPAPGVSDGVGSALAGATGITGTLNPEPIGAGRIATSPVHSAQSSLTRMARR